jgi:hypothetical protein
MTKEKNIRLSSRNSREGSLKSTAVVSNSGLKVEYFAEKGLGIVATGNFEKRPVCREVCWRAY